MKKLIVIFTVSLLFIGCGFSNQNKDQQTYYEEEIDYDTLFQGYIYRKVIRHYNYRYNVDSYYTKSIDSTHYMGIHINEYGDTTEIDYIDTINFSKREEE